MSVYRARNRVAELPILPEVWLGQLAILAVVAAFVGGALTLILAGIGTGTCQLQALGDGIHGPVRYQLLAGCHRFDAAARAWVAMPASPEPAVR